MTHRSGIFESRPVGSASSQPRRLSSHASFCAPRRLWPEAIWGITLPFRMAFHDPTLVDRDPEIHRLLREEVVLESEKLRLIPSENYVSRAVLEATGSILTNKYSEGYAGKRYYEGQQVIDQVEELAVKRLRELFG